jgi:peroxiredoxin
MSNEKDMPIKPIVFFLAVGLVAFSFVYYQATHTGAPRMVNIGDVAPDFTVNDSEGKQLKLSDLRGNLVFLNFWATWCPPCVHEMPEMELLNRAFKDRKFQMVAVSVDDNWETVAGFYKEHNLSLPAYLDAGQKVSTRYNVFKFPETFIIDRNGHVLKHYIGEQRWASPQLLASFDTLIKEQETAQSASR